jgi:uncharacterized phage protein (TIGR01671 family)
MEKKWNKYGVMRGAFSIKVYLKLKIKIMKEFKFRAKRKLVNEWIEGVPYFEFMVCGKTTAYYDDEVPMSEYTELDYVMIIPETVGQFTGLKDKNGKKIFEGDIVTRYVNRYHDIYDNVTLGFIDQETIFEGYVYGVIKFIPSKGYVIKKYKTVDIDDNENKQNGNINIISAKCEIIGNIHDNPEFLEVTTT